MRCLLAILGITLWDMLRNADILKETSELAFEDLELLRQKHAAVV